MRVVGYRQRYPQPWGETSDLESALRELKATKSPLECGLQGISGMLPWVEMAERTGLEPATSGVTGQHSNQLNYRSAFATRSNRPTRYCT